MGQEVSVFQEHRVGLQCDVCARVYQHKMATAILVRRAAKADGWKHGKNYRLRPRHFDACDRHQLPEGYKRI